MNRALRTGLVSAAVLLSGTVAFAVAAAITPPGVDDVNVVVTDRPVLSVAAASTVRPRVAAVVTSTPAAGADKPAARKKAPATSRTAVTGAGSGGRPKSIAAPVVKPKPPLSTVDTDPDHEVVTPPVRDDDDEHDDDEYKSDSSSPSADFDDEPSRDETDHSGSKGD